MRLTVRARWLAAALLTCAVTASAAATGGAPAAGAGPANRDAAAANRPNILILLMDDARTGMTWVMPKATAWMTDGGTNFPNAVVTTPSCCPSRSTIMSGRYVHNTGVTQQNGIGNYDHARTLEHDLKAAGYHTAALGKLFNDWDLDQRPPYFDNWALGNGYVNTKFVVDGTPVIAPYSTTFIAQQVNRYIDSYARTDGAPWLIYAGFTAPHSPFTPEPRYANVPYPWTGNPATQETDRSDKPAYVRSFNFSQARGADVRQAMLRTMLSVDDAVDAIHRHLVATGEDRDTVVFLLSDNGKLFGEHGLQEKFMPYLQAERVPFFVRWPGHLPSTQDNRLAANLDVTPTALAAAGLVPSYQYDGRNLLAPAARSRLLLEYWRDPDNGAAVPTWASTYVPNRYLYTELYRDDGSLLDREYYNLATDPWQLTNLFRDGVPGNDPPVAPLSGALAAQRACTGTACP